MRLGKGAQDMKRPKDRTLLQWDKHTAFSRAAGLILDGLETAFHLVAPHGRDETMAAAVRILDYYCTPKDGPDGNSEIERKLLQKKIEMNMREKLEKLRPKSSGCGRMP